MCRGAVITGKLSSRKAVSEKVSRSHCFSLGTFSGKGGKGNVWGREGRTVSLGSLGQGTWLGVGVKGEALGLRLWTSASDPMIG